MTVRTRLKAIIEGYTNPDLTIEDLETLKQQLESEVVHEIARRKLFVVTVEDPRDTARSQFETLIKALAADGYGIEYGNSRKEKDGDVRWEIYRLGDPTDTAVLKLGKDGRWSVGIAFPKKSDIGDMSLTDLLKRKSPEAKLDGWKLAK